jgi:hypothetical protein
LRHDGKDKGFRSTLWLVQASGLGVLVFYNSDLRSADSVVEAAIDQLLGLSDVPAPDEKTPSSTWEKYTGTYLDPNVMGWVTISLQGSELTANIPGLGVDSLALTQVAGDRFSASLNGEAGEVTFYPGQDGATHWFVTRQGVGVKQ